MTGFPVNLEANHTRVLPFLVSIQTLLIDTEQSMDRYPLCLENAATGDW